MVTVNGVVSRYSMVRIEGTPDADEAFFGACPSQYYHHPQREMHLFSAPKALRREPNDAQHWLATSGLMRPCQCGPFRKDPVLYNAAPVLARNPMAARVAGSAACQWPSRAAPIQSYLERREPAKRECMAGGDPPRPVHLLDLTQKPVPGGGDASVENFSLSIVFQVHP
jgi:hypothetical protein